MQRINNKIKRQRLDHQIALKLAALRRENAEHKRAIAALYEREEHFRLLVEGVRDYAIFGLDTAGHVVTWSTGAQRIKGYRAEEIIGKHFSCFYPTEEVAKGGPESNLKQASEHGRFEEEGLRIAKNGTAFWASVVITAQHNDRGVLRGFTTITRDITARKKAEDVLRENDRRTRILKDVAVAANAVSSFRETLEIAVAGIGQYMGWPVGHAYIVGEGARVITSDIWHLVDPEKFLRFRQLTESLTFRPGEGLPGRVFVSQKACLIENIASKPTVCIRRTAAIEAGIRGAFAFPILGRGAVVAILEFFSENEELADASTVELSQQIGAQLGVVLERNRAEDELFQSRQMLQMVLDTIPQRVFWKDRQSRYLGCNKPFAQDAVLGEPKVVVGKTDYDFGWGAENAKRYRADDRMVIETGASKLAYEEQQRRREGGMSWVRTSKVPLRDREGQIFGVLGTYEDITEQMQAKERLICYSQEIKELYNNAPCGYHALDADGTILNINDTFLKWLGYSRKELVGKKIVSLHPPYYKETFEEKFRNFKIRGCVENLEVQFVKKDGTLLDVMLNAEAVTNEDGEFLWCRTTIFDISERKRTNHELRKLSSAVEQSPVSVVIANTQGGD